MKLKKIKNALLVTLSLALVAAASVAITYAIGDSQSFGDKTNEFKEGNITATLTEVHWDGVKGNPTGSEEDPTVATADQGKTKADSYTPGQIIPKDPKVNNTNTKDISEYVGIKVAYTATINGTEYTYYTKTQFETAIAKLCNTAAGAEGLCSGWSGNDDGTHFYYSAPVAYGKASGPLFNHVKINSFDTGTTKKYKVKTYASKTADAVDVETDELPTFNIILTGYAISADGSPTAAEVQTALENLMA